MTLFKHLKIATFTLEIGIYDFNMCLTLFSKQNFFLQVF